jgi:hypothetical protein
MKKIKCLLIFLFLSNCEIIPSEKLFVERVEDFLHRPESYLVSNLGAPTSSYITDDYKILTYSKKSTESLGILGQKYGDTYNLDCQINFTVSKKSGNVITYNYKGNNCVAYGGLKGILN